MLEHSSRRHSRKMKESKQDNDEEKSKIQNRSSYLKVKYLNFVATKKKKCTLT